LLVEADAELAGNDLPQHTTPSKKPVTKRQSDVLLVNEVQSVASAATKLLTQIATQRQCKPAETDKDWNFCRYLYSKLKAIPDSDEKEDMLLEIQVLINRTRRQCLKRTLNGAAVENGYMQTAVFSDEPQPAS